MCPYYLVQSGGHLPNDTSTVTNKEVSDVSFLRVEEGEIASMTLRVAGREVGVTTHHNDT